MVDAVCEDQPRRRSYRVLQNQEMDQDPEGVELYLRKRRNAADGSRIVLAPRNKHRTVPRALPQSHSYINPPDR
jgi:hypothetical protein